MSSKNIKRLLVALALLFFAFTLFHASWIAPDPHGRPKLIASSPLDLPRDPQGCVLTAAAGYGAADVSPETQMLQTAAGTGADAIVMDSELANGTAILPRFFESKCPNAAARRPLTEAMTAVSKPDQFIRVNSAAHAKAVLAAVPADSHLRIFFAAKETDIAAFDGKPAFSIAKARQCASDYRTSGMAGIIPASCTGKNGGTMLLTLDELGFTLWGWPNRFLARMAQSKVRLIIAADVQGDKITGLTELPQYDDIAGSYNGYIWVDDIAELGPALKR
jgi:glycerophosphoryl diester phosphodiesterase